MMFWFDRPKNITHLTSYFKVRPKIQNQFVLLNLKIEQHEEQVAQKNKGTNEKSESILLGKSKVRISCTTKQKKKGTAFSTISQMQGIQLYFNSNNNSDKLIYPYSTLKFSNQVCVEFFTHQQLLHHISLLRLCNILIMHSTQRQKL